ncbi:biopolymer transporter ExbD [Rhodanobacter sp. L36]|uniref:biopolymer transporter ExbD n=1 Tax=Rhodanobacter sp. L36 TaxID=1747221 RepID=UPI00131DEFD3|nr:biopolymer transporter ExbD [Rhodanobacter sp. L36]
MDDSSRKHGDLPSPSIDLSPLVGLLLVLVIVMICASWRAPITRLPLMDNFTGSDGPVCVNANDDCGLSRYTIVVPASGEAYIDGMPSVSLRPWGTLAWRVTRSHSRSTLWSIKADDKAKAQHVIDVLDALQANDLKAAIAERND